MKEITSHNVTKINRNSDRAIVRATVSVAVSVSDIDSICDRVWAEKVHFRFRLAFGFGLCELLGTNQSHRLQPNSWTLRHLATHFGTYSSYSRET